MPLTLRATRDEFVRAEILRGGTVDCPGSKKTKLACFCYAMGTLGFHSRGKSRPFFLTRISLTAENHNPILPSERGKAPCTKLPQLLGSTSTRKSERGQRLLCANDLPRG